MANGIVTIHGKKYETVALRVHKFYERYPDWRLLTTIVYRDDTVVVMRAEIHSNNGDLMATGHAEEYRKASEINRTSALENAETSALGRALAALGLGGTEFASADEVSRAISGEKQAAPISPTSEALLDVDQITLAKVLTSVIDMYDAAQHGQEMDYALHETLVNLEQDEKLALWHGLKQYSKVRAWVKKVEQNWRNDQLADRVAMG